MKTKTENQQAMEVFNNAPVPKAVLKNAVPAMAAMLMVLIYNLADTFFIGQTRNDILVAAVSLATPVFLIFMAVGTIFGMGGTSVISRAMGQGRKEYAKKVCSFCMWSCVGTGIFLAAVFLLFMDQILTLVGASADTWEPAKAYLTIVAFGGPFVLISNCYSNIIRAEGQPGKAMMGQLIGNLTNIVLDPVMILAFRWGIAGAAVATVIGNVVGAGYYIVYFLRGKSILSIHIRDFSVKDRIPGNVLAIGIPASLGSLLMSISQIIVNARMAGYGDMALAGMGVAMKVNMIVVMLLIGLGTGIQPLLGYCYGARNRKRYIAVLKFSLGLAFCLSMVMTVICYLGAGPLVTAFLDNPDAFQYGMSFSRTYILSGPIIGILFVLINAIQSTGAALPSLILSISRQGLLYLPILALFSQIFDSANLIAGAQPLTDYLSATLAVILFLLTYRHYFRDFPEVE